MAANSALEEVYGILRTSYADVIDADRRNDSSDRPAAKNYHHHHHHHDDDDDDVWRILEIPRGHFVVNVCQKRTLVSRLLVDTNSRVLGCL